MDLWTLSRRTFVDLRCSVAINVRVVSRIRVARRNVYSRWIVHFLEYATQCRSEVHLARISWLAIKEASRLRLFSLQ